ncbi:uncharacterized protein HGUI_03249 [Hanseniaspora guilliermondii]|uniref:Tricalbin-3 n=1 Tax=Hanseniaspora guilliermondii TaxID=56406 RepID=A0A1L0CR83_9ASCO|nr:uncharacterized protein HGUI_03249 [Hanseniaspora guilliermondii]
MTAKGSTAESKTTFDTGESFKSSAVSNENDIFVATAALNKKANQEIFKGKSEKVAIPIEELKPNLLPSVLKDRSNNLADSSIPATKKNELLANVEEQDLGKIIDNKDSKTLERAKSDKFLDKLIKELSSKPEFTFKLETFDKFVSSEETASFISNKGRDPTRPIKIKEYVEEFFYTDYYSNTSLMIFTCLWSYFMAKIGFSYFSLLVIWFFVASTYKKSIRRINRNLRDDIKRIEINETLSDKTETINWLNQFLAKFWVIYMPVLSQQVKDAVNPTLEDVTPGYGIDALTLDEFTLGTKAPTIDAIKSYTKKGKDIIEMDWKISFTPNDTSNMTSNEIKRKVNPKIALGITVGKSFVSKSLPVLVENINVSAHAKVTIHLSENFPNIKMVSISLLDHLFIDFALKPVGGDTLGLDIMSFLPGLKTFVTTMIDAGVGPMLYSPNKLDIDVEEIMESSVNDAIGCIAVTIEDYDLDEKHINSKLGSNPLNLDKYSYLTLETSGASFNNVENKHFLSLKKDKQAESTVFIPVNTLDQDLTLFVDSYHASLTPKQVNKRREFAKNKKSHKIGGFNIHIKDLDEKNEGNAYTSEAITEKLYKTGKKVEGEPSEGSITYKLQWLPIDPKKSTNNSSKSVGKEKHKTAEYVINGSSVDDDEENEDSDEENNDDDESKGSSSKLNLAKNGPGILKMTLQDVTNLFVKVAPFGQLNPSATFSVDGKVVHNFRKLKRINEPSWNEIIEILIPSKKSSLLKLQFFDTQFGSNILIAEYIGVVSDLLAKWSADSYIFDATVPTSLTTQFPSAAQTSPKIRAKGVWKPLAIGPDIVDQLFASKEKDVSFGGRLDSIAKTEYIGGLRVYIKSCDLKSSDLSGVGDIDPYVSLSLSNHIKFKSHYFPDNKAPVYDQVCWIPVKHENEICILSVYDYQNVGKDRFFGSTTFNISKFINRDPQGNILPYLKGDKLVDLKLKGVNNDTKKSTITVSVAFVPVEKVFTNTELPLVEHWKQQLEETQKALEQEQREYSEDMKKNPDDYEVIPYDDESKDNIFVKNLNSKKLLSSAELLAYNSGVFSMEINNIKVDSKTHLQVTFDDSMYPSLVTFVAKNGVIPKTSGSGFIRDLKHSITIFRLTTKATVTKAENVVDEWSVSTFDILTKILSENGGDAISIQSPKGTASFSFKAFLFPSKKALDVSESVFDTGELHINIINATDLPSHDRNGKSDPFIDVLVNNVSAYQTKVVKKTLDPTWNEVAKINIPSISRSTVTLLAYDWDRVGKNDLLSTVVFPLTQLTLDKSVQEWQLQLSPKGVLNLKTTFIPKYIQPPLEFNSFGLAGVPLKALSDVAGLGAAGVGAGVGVATGVAGVGVSGLSKGSKFLRKGLGGNKKYAKNDDVVSVTSKKTSTALNGTGTPVHKRVASLASSIKEDDISSKKYDVSVPNQALANVGQNSLSPDRGSHSLATRQLIPNHVYDGKITIISGNSLGPAVQLRLSLNSGNGNIKLLHKTETRRSDKNKDVYFGDVIPFKSSKNGIILVEGYGKHTFGKDTELGFSQISLSDAQILEPGQTLVRIANGTLILEIQYGL